MLLCPVRNCRMALVREKRRLICPRGHSFDVARSGYINLLQPQDRRSKEPGDTADAVAARRRLHDRGVTAPLLHGIAEIMAASPGDIVLDAGCGDGFYLGSLTRQTGFRAYGIDISVPAIDAAARRYPECEWIVANADRVVPYADRSFSIVLSITARMNSSEFRRVLREDGHLVVAVPAPADLIELRGAGVIAWLEPSRRSRMTSRSSIGAASPPRQTSTLPPFTTFYSLSTGRCERSRSKRCD
jgi:23S rRNA (guanine745-N1)-methyltransferase